MGVCCYDCDKKHNRHDIIFPQTTCRLLDGLKLGSGLLLIVSFKSEKNVKYVFSNTASQRDGRSDDMQSQYVRALHYSASRGKNHSID